MSSAPRDPGATYTRGRRFAIGVNVLVVSLLAPCVGGLLLYLLFRPELRRRVDLTARATFTLSERTQKVLEGLAQRAEPIDVYTCFRSTYFNDANNIVPGLDRVEEAIGTHCNDVLREFEVHARGKLRLHVYDPNASGHMARVEELSRRIGERADNVVVVDSGERMRRLKLKDLAEFDQGAATTQSYTRPTLSGFRDEEALAQSILSVTTAQAPRVGILRGHGERAVDNANTGTPLNRFMLGLLAQNYEFATVGLAEGESIAHDGAKRIDVLVIAEPTKQLVDHEVATLVRFAKEGGALLVMLDPDSATSLDTPLLNEVYGLSRTLNPVCQETQYGEWTRKANVFETDFYSDHPITKPLRTKHMRTHWENASGLVPLGRAEQSKIVQNQLVWTGPKAWLDLPVANPAPGQKGNLQFDRARRRRASGSGYPAARGGARAVCWRASVRRPPARPPTATDLALNTIDWLARRGRYIAIAARPSARVRVDLTTESTAIDLRRFGVPALHALLLGVAVYWMRLLPGAAAHDAIVLLPGRSRRSRSGSSDPSARSRRRARRSSRRSSSTAGTRSSSISTATNGSSSCASPAAACRSASGGSGRARPTSPTRTPPTSTASTCS
jgi:hypothetical protein